MTSKILQLHKQLKNREITCQKLIEYSLQALKSNKHNSSNFVLEDTALEMAKKVDEKIKNGQKIGILEGIPFGVKDVFMLQASPSTGSSDFLRNYISPYTATAIQKLIDAGAIPVAKENCDSFGHGSTNENSAFGPVKNAIDTNLVSGGSSGGSAVNVALGVTVFSIGGDTGGSVRQPAGYNKIFGLKPTYGRISRYGIMAYASSTDCVGPIASSVEDIKIVLNTMSGKDFRDQTTFDSTPIEDIENFDKNIPTKIGFYPSFLEDASIDPSIHKEFYETLEKLKKTGVEIVPLKIEKPEILVAVYYALAMAETASNLARLDGTNYGKRAVAETLKESYSITRSENFTKETKTRIIGGNQVLSQGFSDEIYHKSDLIRNQFAQHLSTDLDRVDFILSPVSPNLPPKIGDSLTKTLDMYLSDIFTIGFSLAGVPSFTIPVGTSVGMQIAAKKTEEEKILKFANYLNDILG